MYKPNLKWLSENEFDGKVIDNGSEICKVKDIFLVNARLKLEGEIIISEEYPMPLFWWQYTNHEDPERNAGFVEKVKTIENGNFIELYVTSTNKSRSILSNYFLKISYSEIQQSYTYEIDAKLTILNEWIISHNPSHGELEFCNFYPYKTFNKHSYNENKYQYLVYENDKNEIIRLPKCHLELNEYHNIQLRPGGRFYYLLEEENPVIQFLANNSTNSHVGICAYMWDSHFGYKICKSTKEVILRKGEEYQAQYKIFSLPKIECRKILENATLPELKYINTIPIYYCGINSFSRSLLDFPENENIWPWQTEILSDTKNGDNGNQIELLWDREEGFDDKNSLSIILNNKASARWIYSSLGPEFGMDAFIMDRKYRLNAKVKLASQHENSFVRIGFRIHLEGRRNVFDFKEYSYYYSEIVESTKSCWLDCYCETPLIHEKPERIHLLLEFFGRGRCWFDNVFFETVR